MPLLTRQSVENIKNRIDIVEAISPHVQQLKKAGSQWKCLSPFSAEKTPSFYIHPIKQAWYCYSSGQGGDVIRFVQLLEHMNFQEAAEALAERFNIEVEYERGSGPNREQRSLHRELRDMHEQAAHYYHDALMADNQQAADIRDYWVNGRKFTLELAKELKIGLAPPGDTGLIELLIKKGFSENAIRQSGLFYVKGNVRQAWPIFRGRLMIPIRNAQAQVIAFTARQLSITPKGENTSEAKYVNSPETPIFHKSNLVFGLDRAYKNIRDNGAFLLVEGQLDAIRCWTCGLETAVAPQGTSITPEQMVLLKRYANRIDVLLDGDKAGQKGAYRMLPLAIAAGHEVRFIPLPEGADPDDLLAEKGATAVEELREKSLSEMEFLCNFLLPEKNPSPARKEAALQEIYAVLAQCPSEGLQADYLAEAGRILGLLNVSDRALIQGMRQYQEQNRSYKSYKTYENGASGNGTQDNHPPANGAQATNSAPSPATPGLATPQNQRLTTSEHDLLLCLFANEELGQLVSTALDDSYIDKTQPAGKLLARVLAEFAEDMWQGLDAFQELLETEEERNLYFSIITNEFEIEQVPSLAEKCVRKIIEKHANLRIQHLQQQIMNLPVDSTQFPQFQGEIKKLRKLKSECREVSLIPA